MRAPFQVLIIPYQKVATDLRFLIAKRADDGHWQGFSGGGEINESPLEAAQREFLEESGLTSAHWMKLDSCAMIPRVFFKGHEKWQDHPYVIPEYAYAARVEGTPVLSREHSDYQWGTLDEVQQLLRYDSNRTAVWETYERMRT